MDPEEILGESLLCERTGEHQKALDMLVGLVEGDPYFEQAWLWLGDLADTLADRIIALENALTINPNNARARERLGMLKTAQANTRRQNIAHAQQLLDTARQALRRKRLAESLEALRQAVLFDYHLETAWVLLGMNSPDLNEQITALETALKLNPRNSQARARWKQCTHIRDDFLALGEYLEKSGDWAGAENAYIQAYHQSTSSGYRLEAARRLDELALRREAPKYRPVSPWVTVTRLTLGPAVLYLFLVMIQSGLNPLRVSPMFCGAGFLVLLGSFVLVITREPILRSLWLRWVGDDGAMETFLRGLLAVLSLLLLLAVFGVLMLDSVQRLQLLFFLM